ncbi:hybrid sensor histidine kinase/response regulator [Aquisphaera giovannonii]|uniref:hybrid sensor histidine kinase/response regulator n=1 Tax=Aquisphaera giovannonii TaxID=406548 RepID=UPI0011DFF721|nr:chemotaxis protein CheW [Aquisphaera giovannonii]
MAARPDEFVAQAREHLATLEQALLSLEKGGADADPREQADRCLRAVHSIKGDAGFLGYTAIRTLADAMESALEVVRDRVERPRAPAVERLIAAGDRLATLVDDPENSNSADLGGILTRLEQVRRPAPDAADSWAIDLREAARPRSGRLAEYLATLAHLGTVVAPVLVADVGDLREGLPAGPLRLEFRLGSNVPREEIRRVLGLADESTPREPHAAVSLQIDLDEWSRGRGLTLGPLLAELAGVGPAEAAGLEIGPADLAAGLGRGPVRWHGRLRTALGEAEVRRRLGLGAEAREPGRAQPGPAPPAAPRQPTTGGRVPAPEADRSASLRINVELLDRLMTLAGELTLVRNQSLLAFEREDDRVRPIVQRLDAVTSAIQETVLRARMQPIGNIFGRFPRVVRDLARQLGKRVEVAVVGREVELDKTILEQLSDPLTHLVRNSVDHGIEPPADRIAAGKPEVGRIELTAAHEEGQIRIEIRDDGRGIDPQAVRAKAMAMRLRSEAELDRMSRRDLLSLILLPGFSTARSVSELSGRGVGMDVVKTNIEQLEGTLTIDSRPGLGTAMILRLPLTLAIIPCLMVAAGGEPYAIPQRDLEEAICLHPGLKGRVELAFDSEVYRLRGRLLPVVRLADVLGRPRPFAGGAGAEVAARHDEGPDPRRVAYILVLRSAGRRYGLVVDEIRGTEEVVVKPMHPSIKRVRIFSGATIMGDGRVALIADAAGILEHARPGFEPTRPAATARRGEGGAPPAHRVLLFEYGPSEQFALPLLEIRRVEMAGLDRIERVGEDEFVAVDGLPTRLLRLDQVIAASSPGSPPPGPAPRAALILPKSSPRAVAILATRIVDTESLAVDLQPHPECDRGVIGSAIVRGRMTLFLDMQGLVRRLLAAFEPRGPRPASEGRPPGRVLVVDDTPFFLELIRRRLESEGHRVETAANGEQASALLTAGGAYDLIISDIEMPVMDGWEFAREVRRRGLKIPMLALTSLSGPAYEARARECGYDAYEVKLDQDRLIRAVAGLLAAKEAHA